MSTIARRIAAVAVILLVLLSVGFMVAGYNPSDGSMHPLLGLRAIFGIAGGIFALLGWALIIGIVAAWLFWQSHLVRSQASSGKVTVALIVGILVLIGAFVAGRMLELPGLSWSVFGVIALLIMAMLTAWLVGTLWSGGSLRRPKRHQATDNSDSNVRPSPRSNPAPTSEPSRY